MIHTFASNEQKMPENSKTIPGQAHTLYIFNSGSLYGTAINGTAVISYLQTFCIW